jgi:hypothetical protein
VVDAGCKSKFKGDIGLSFFSTEASRRVFEQDDPGIHNMSGSVKNVVPCSMSRVLEEKRWKEMFGHRVYEL